VLWPAMRGAAEQFICPVAGHTQDADTDRRHGARAR
jgi:hypothetical protein